MELLFLELTNIEKSALISVLIEKTHIFGSSSSPQ